MPHSLALWWNSRTYFIISLLSSVFYLPQILFSFPFFGLFLHLAALLFVSLSLSFSNFHPFLFSFVLSSHPLYLPCFFPSSASFLPLLLISFFRFFPSSLGFLPSFLPFFLLSLASSPSSFLLSSLPSFLPSFLGFFPPFLPSLHDFLPSFLTSSLHPYQWRCGQNLFNLES